MNLPSDDTKICRQKAYRAYHDAKGRCNNTKHPRYKDWGGRGIEFRFSSFQEFLDAVGLPQKGQSIDRKDNNAHYCCDNVRWASREQQQHNKRVYQHNKSGYTGVRQVKAKGLVTETWQAYVTVNRKFIQLYSGPSFEDAVNARKSFTYEDLK